MSAYEISISEKEGRDELTCKGSLIINHIEKIYAELREKLKFDKAMTVVIDNPESIDITFVQLVISLKKTFAEKGLEFTVKSSLKDDMVQLISKAGLNKDLNI